jgi:mercuric ion transport protein
MTKKQTKPKKIPWFGVGVIATCCLVPLMPLLYAIAGAWISSITTTQTFRFLFIIPILLYIGLGYRKFYLLSNDCKEDQSCASDEVQQKQRILFWISSLLIMLIWVFA